MRRSKRLFVILLLLCATGTTSIAQPVEVMKIGFFIVVKDEKGGETFVETDVVPNVVGQKYGWVADITTKKETVNWSETLVFPEPRTGGEVGANTTILNNGHAAETNATTALDDGYLYNFGVVGNGDPNGQHNLIVTIEKQLAGVFTFNMVPSDAGPHQSEVVGKHVRDTKSSSGVEVKEIGFFITEDDDKGEGWYVVSDTVPNVDGQEYGWIAEVVATNETVRWVEELRFPRAPFLEGLDSTVTVSQDGRTVWIERTIGLQIMILNFIGLKSSVLGKNSTHFFRFNT